MKDLKRLSCALCEFKSDNLVDHIQTAHADHPEGSAHEDGVLVWYMVKYGTGEETDLVHPEYGVESKKEGSVESAKASVAGVEFMKGRGGAYVPELNNAYHFSAVSKEIMQDMIENRRIMLIGHTGCGKSSLFEQVGARIDQGILRVNLNGQTTIGDFVGLWTVKGGETIWVDGALPKAMRDGLWLCLDEIDFAEPQILSVLNAVLEKSGKLTLKEKGHEVVVPHPDFRIFATANGVGCMAGYRGLYQGTNLMNEAFLDRWRAYHVDYLPPDEEAQVIVGTVPRMTLKIATVIVKVGNLIREAFKKEEVQCTMSLRRLLDWSELMVRYKDPVKAAQASIFSKVSPDDAKVIEGIIKRIMVGAPSEK